MTERKGAGGRTGPPQGRQDPEAAPESVGEVLRALTGSGPWAWGMRLGELARRWGEVVGERLSEECAPAGLSGGVLVVRAADGAWAAQLRFLAEQVREAADRVLGGGVVREVRVVVGEASGGQPP